MYNITLICTVHKENGKCNYRELNKIIEIINPDIIFEEIPYSIFTENYKEQSKNILEINAIKNYLEKHQVIQIPVDRYGLSNSQQKDFDYMFEKIVRKSSEYRELLKNHSVLENQYGFEFLNSNKCIQLMQKINDLIGNVIKDINNERLFCAYKLWKETNEKRENIMINNIYKYSYQHRYNKAIFLIGSGHRKSTIKKIQVYKRKEKLKLNWRFNSYKNIL
jgi:hypothetical protein